MSSQVATKKASPKKNSSKPISPIQKPPMLKNTLYNWKSKDLKNAFKSDPEILLLMANLDDFASKLYHPSELKSLILNLELNQLIKIVR